MQEIRQRAERLVNDPALPTELFVQAGRDLLAALDRVDTLEAELASKQAGLLDLGVKSGEQIAVLRSRVVALTKAAKWVKEESQQLIGMDDPFGSQGPPILVGANAYFALRDALVGVVVPAAEEEK